MKKRVGLTRKRADEMIALLEERIDVVNSDPQYLYGVYRVSVFGSYLSDKEKLGDLDLAIELGPKCRDKKKHGELCDLQEAECKGGMIDRAYWPREKVLRALRGRNYGFSFHDYSELNKMIRQNTVQHAEIHHNVRYSDEFFTRAGA